MHDVHSPCPLFGIAGGVLNASTLGEKWPAGAPLDDALDEECVEGALNWERRSWKAGENRTDLALRGLRAASWIMRRAIESLRPGLVLSWYGPMAGFAGFESAIRTSGVPRLYVERGAMPMTFVLDPIGVLAPSIPATDPRWVRMMAEPPADDEVARGRVIANTIAEERRENWPNRPTPAVEPRGEERVIAYFGSNDLGHEYLTPDRWPAAGLPFGDSERSLERLLIAVNAVAPSARVVIKRHPHDPLKTRFDRFADGRRVMLDDTLSIHDAVDRRWVIATTSGSIGWIALACGADAISLTKRSYTGSGAIFEPIDDESLRAAVMGAIRGGIPSDDPRRFAALARCGSNYAYSDDERYFAAGVQSAESMADRLLRESAATRGDSDPEAWLEDLESHAVAVSLSDSLDRTPAYMQQMTTHEMIASAIVMQLDAARPVALLGFGRNGRAVYDAAVRAGFEVTVFDDRFTDGTRPAGVTDSVRLAATIEDLSEAAQWVVSPLEDASLCVRIPGGVVPIRWSDTLRAITEGSSGRPAPAALCSSGAVRNSLLIQRKASDATA